MCIVLFLVTLLVTNRTIARRPLIERLYVSAGGLAF